MPYARGRTYYDADSHLMETSDWLVSHADPEIRDRLKPLSLGGAGRMAEEAVAAAEARRGDLQAASEAAGNLMKAKGWSALGAFDAAERSEALDLLGFDAQLVFSTFAATQFVADDDLDVVYGGTRAHNRAMADFCSTDKRLLGVAFVPLQDAEHAADEVEAAIELDCAAVLVPSHPPKGKSPTHPDYDGVWARLQDAEVPFMLHVGGGGRPLRPAFHENGRPRPTDFLGGGENVRSKDFMVLHNPPETFLSCMALDGIFEAYPRLLGGCIEQGAMWVVPWLKRLDLAQQTFARTEPILRDLPMAPSEYIRRQVKFTPFPQEPVGWMIREAGDELFLFSSDYPHPEGGRDPLSRFQAALADQDEAAKDKFYAGNFAEMMRL
jgi:predicted TIM-barrel fold metal-dependent hydrolase